MVRRWYSLSREEQGQYYEEARQESQMHMQLYPLRDNYCTKKKGNRMKKCRARYGLDQQSRWCQPCTRKKKCIQYMETGNRNYINQSKDNLDGYGSIRGNRMKKCRARYGLDHSQWCQPCRRKKKCIQYMEAGNGNDGNHSSCSSMGDAHTPPEEKNSLIDLTDSETKSESESYNFTSKNFQRFDHSPDFDKVKLNTHALYLISPYGYTNRSARLIPVSKTGGMGFESTGDKPFFCHNGNPLSQPPPAHMGILPYQLDGNDQSTRWLTRSPMYPAVQYTYPMLSPGTSQVASWQTPIMYPLSLDTRFSDFYRFSPTELIQSHPLDLSSHPAIVTPVPKQKLPDVDHKSQTDYKNDIDGKNNKESNEKEILIKKPTHVSG